jgi:hypothetical protein
MQDPGRTPEPMTYQPKLIPNGRMAEHQRKETMADMVK